MPGRVITVLRFGTAAVWIAFGLVFKVLHLVPRHETIVAAIIGADWAGPATLGIGVAEVAMGVWILTRRWPLACAAAQTIVIASMNTLELTLAREHLLAPTAMVCANTAFLALGWFLALRTGDRQRTA